VKAATLTLFIACCTVSFTSLVAHELRNELLKSSEQA